MHYWNTLVLALSAIPRFSYAYPMIEDDPFYKQLLSKRDLAGDVCGSETGATVASDSRNKETWTNNKISEWFADALDPYQRGNWKYPDNLQRQPDIQSIVLGLMGNDGSEKCDEIIGVTCSGNGLPWQKCKEKPEAHFVWFALTHFAQFLSKMQQTLTISTTAIEGLTSDIVSKFYTPQDNPQKLIVPISIASGIAGAVSSVWPPAAVAAGVGGIVTGILTQAGLDTPDPLEQWAEVTTAVAKAFQDLTEGYEKFFNNVLKELPDQTLLNSLTRHKSGTNYIDDPLQLPQMLSSGEFAKTPTVGSFNNGVFGGFVASAVNALWVMDQVFILILSDEAWGKGFGEACNAFPKQTECINGVAHILLRWKSTQTKAPVVPNSIANPSELNPAEWFVWGAYEAGPDHGGEKNANNFGEYKLDRRDIVESSVKTWNEHGFPYKDQNAATMDHLRSNPLGLTQKDLMFFSLPICDIGKIMGSGKHLDDDVGGRNANKLEVWGGCTCTQGEGWPSDYSLSNPVPKSVCSSHWKNNP